MKKLITILVLICSVANAQEMVLKNNWYLKNSIEVNAIGEEVSSLNFIQQNWYRTSVPSTVLNAFVKNGVYPDPRIGMNNFLIPDVSDSFNQKHGLSKYSYLKDRQNPWKDPYWYRTEVLLPKQYRGKMVWLTFKGINYRADIWVNGHLVADHNQIVGMFRRFKFNITSFVEADKKNCIAVKIYQVDNPGTPDPGTQFEVFGNTRGHASDIFKDETMKMSGGWDCAPVVRDRNIGIYQDVIISATGNVAIENPYVITTLPKHDTSRADILLRAEVRNISNKNIEGILTAKINLLNDIEFPSYTKHIVGNMPSIQVSKKVSLNPDETKEIVFDPKDFQTLSIENPYLWYPNGYGEQYLHHLKLTFQTDGKVSDTKELNFGIREITTQLKQIGNDFGRIFYVNGKRIFCKGGWLQPDMLLDMDRKRVFDESRLMAEANVNIVGNEDMPSPSDETIESYDKYGIMYWEVFFQCSRMYPGDETAHNPLDHHLAVEEVKDILKRYRNNPSIVAWFSANEVIVDEDLYNSTKKAVKSLDATRPFIPTTSINWDVDTLTPYIKDDLPTGTTDDGAPDYEWNPPCYYFDKVEEIHLQMFRNELGIPSIPLYSSLRKFIPTVVSDSLKNSSKRNIMYPLDSIWAEHGAWDGPNYCFRSYDNAIRTLYGNPLTPQEYALKAQYLNADSYRSMFEAANHRMWDITSGVMLWKLNSCWPDVGWQIYDWYLNPNASYFFAKKAMEPVHIQMNANSRIISVINATHSKLNNLVVNAKIIDYNMNTEWSFIDTLSVNSDSYQESVTIPKIKEIPDIYFVKLELRDIKGKQISDNLYWFCSQHQEFSSLARLQKVDLQKDVKLEETSKEYKITVKLKNNTDNLSFFNHLILLNPITHQEILPVFWSDNFVTLFPDDNETITAVVAKTDMGGQKPIVDIE